MSDDEPTEPYAYGIEPLKVERDGDVVALGARYPLSGDVVVEWRRSAFPEGERTSNVTASRYGSVSDAETATGGEIVFENAEVWNDD